MSFINTENKYTNDGIKFFNLANIYYYGIDIEKDFKKAYELYIKASSFGVVEAFNMLGVLHFNGEGVEKNSDNAINMLEKASNQGSTTAMFNLSLVYIVSDEKRDYAKAHSYLERLADMGYNLANDVLGYLYYNGFGENKNYDKALNYWTNKESTPIPNIDTVETLDNSSYTPANLDNFEDELPDPPCPQFFDEFELDSFVSESTPSQEDISTDNKYTIGNIDNFEELTLENVNSDFNATDSRIIEADNFYNGTLGDLDYVKAFNIYFNLAQEGNAYAQLKVANMFKDGLGVQKDYEKSLEWYSKSLSNYISKK